MAAFATSGSFSVDDFDHSLDIMSPEASPDTAMFDTDSVQPAFMADSEDEDDIELFKEPDGPVKVSQR